MAVPASTMIWPVGSQGKKSLLGRREPPVGRRGNHLEVVATARPDRRYDDFCQVPSTLHSGFVRSPVRRAGVDPERPLTPGIEVLCGGRIERHNGEEPSEMQITPSIFA